MKIKIIDLLNMRANGEQLPLQIKYKTIIYNLMADNTYRDNGNEEFISFWREDINYILNDEIEIIEEDKKIEKLKIKDGKITGNWENGNYYCYTLSSPQAVIVNKLNELVDEVNKLKEKL